MRWCLQIPCKRPDVAGGQGELWTQSPRAGMDAGLISHFCLLRGGTTTEASFKSQLDTWNLYFLFNFHVTQKLWTPRNFDWEYQISWHKSSDTIVYANTNLLKMHTPYLYYIIWKFVCGMAERVSVDPEKETVKLYWLINIFCILQVHFIFIKHVSHRFIQGSKPFFIK